MRVVVLTLALALGVALVAAVADAAPYAWVRGLPDQPYKIGWMCVDENDPQNTGPCGCEPCERIVDLLV
ncbi:MAG TPA: hypothetical protein VHH36_01730 [Candidatus Thermoplasmatota archaeon]|nr:hypothetical protein [Candidatus Thermoplasmatota archaeon]